MMLTIHAASPLRIGIALRTLSWRSLRGPAFAASLALVVLVSGLSVAPAQGQMISREYPLKAAFLYNFANYVEWPAAAFQSSTSPFIIGVLGPNPFGSMLDELSKKTVRGRPIVYRQYDSPQESGECHILFISVAVSDADCMAVIEATRRRHMLIVTEANGLARRGSVVNFFVEQNKLRFEINPDAAQQRALRISSKLLSLATLIEPSKVVGP
jgi:hypothetical protein